MKRIISLVLVFIFSCCLAGCAGNAGKSDKENKAVIAVSIVPQATFVEKIVENNIGYTIGKESVNTTFRTDNVSYGVNTDFIIIGDIVMVEYKYLVIPPLFGLLI